MADFLKNFIPGEDIKASDTNDNNQFLLDKISDNAQNLQEYLNQRLGVMESNIATIQATLQNNIDNLSNAIDEIKENEPEVSKGQNGYMKFSNGFIIQWGRIYDDPAKAKYGTFTQNFSIPFSSVNYSIAVGSNYKQTAGDKGASIQVYPNTASNFAYSIRYEQNRGSYTYWIAVGY